MSRIELSAGRDKPVIDRPLIAYAFLAQATHVSGDLLSGLAPIFKPIAKDRVGKRFDAAEFSHDVQALYGIEISPWAVDDLAPRLEATGLLVKVQASESSVAYVYAEMTAVFDEVSESDIRLVIQRFIDFATPTLVRNKVSVSPKALEDAFLAQMVAMDFHSILIKPDRTKEDQKTPGTLSVPKTEEKVQWEADISAQSKIDVLGASFIVDAFHSDRALYDLIVKIASGALIAEVVLNIQDPGTSITLSALKIVLDAPFVMSVLDLSSEESTEYARSLFDKMTSNGASVLVFRHSIEEIQSNLKAVVNNVTYGKGFGATARRLGSSAFKAYLLSVMQDVEAAVSRYDLKVLEAPMAAPAYRFLSEADETTFKLSLGFFENPTAQARDAASVAAIIRLRQGKAVKMSRFHLAQYVFVTENPWIAERSAKFAVNKNIQAANEVPPAITDRYLAGLMLVLFGGKTSELTQYRLLANCTAALEPRNDVIARMHRFLSQLDEQKAKHFRALMTDERAGQHLMQLTLGDSVLITSTNDAEQILEQVELVLGEKYRKERDATVADIKAAHESELGGLLSRQAAMAEDMRATMAEAMTVRDELNGSRTQAEQLADALAAAKQLRLEEKRVLVARSVEYAGGVMLRRHHHIALAVALVTALCALAGVKFLADYGNWPALIAAVATGVLAYIAFGKNPEILFGKHLRALRAAAFHIKAREYDVDNDLHEFEIEWDRGEVRLRT